MGKDDSSLRLEKGIERQIEHVEEQWLHCANERIEQ